MNQTTNLSTAPGEIVGIFHDRAAFEAAVAALYAAGLTRADLSVLDSHESIDAAGSGETSWKEALRGLVGEIKYEGPLVAAGAILLAGGATAAAIAGVIAAATTAAAASEFMNEVTARPHTEAFARAVEAGSIILWVAVETDERARQVQGVLEDHGAENVHLHNRPNA